MQLTNSTVDLQLGSSNEKKISSFKILTQIHEEYDLTPIMEKLIYFLCDLEMNTFSKELGEVFYGNDGISAMVQQGIAKDREEALSFFSKLLRIGMVQEKGFPETIENNVFLGEEKKTKKEENFSDSKILYSLSIQQSFLPILYKTFKLKQDLNSLKSNFNNKFKVSMFDVMMNDMALIFVERQQNLEKTLKSERDEYRKLYLCYSQLKKRDNKFYDQRVRGLELEIEDLKDTNRKKQMMIEKLEKKQSELEYISKDINKNVSQRLKNMKNLRNSIDSETKLQLKLNLEQERKEKKQRHQIKELKSEIVELENENEMLHKHNEMLVQKFNQLKNSAKNAFAIKEKQKNQILMLQEKLKLANEKYNNQLNANSSKAENLIDTLNSRYQNEKLENVNFKKKVDFLQQQLNEMSREFMNITMHLKKNMNSKTKKNVSYKMVNEKIFDLVKDLQNQ